MLYMPKIQYNNTQIHKYTICIQYTIIIYVYIT